jgi:hypothetical protein
MSRRSITELTRRRWPGRDDASTSHSTFLRGLSMGALIGAAIAGSAIWERRRMQQSAARTEPEPSTPGPEEATPAPAE